MQKKQRLIYKKGSMDPRMSERENKWMKNVEWKKKQNEKEKTSERKRTELTNEN